MIVHVRFYELARKVAAANGMTLEELRERHRNGSFRDVQREAAKALRAAGAGWNEAAVVLDREAATVRHMVNPRTFPSKRKAEGEAA